MGISGEAKSTDYQSDLGKPGTGVKKEYSDDFQQTVTTSNDARFIVCFLLLCIGYHVACIGYTLHTLLSDLSTKCRRQEVAKSLGNQARGVQPACTMTIHKIQKSG